MNRIEKIQNFLKTNSLDALLIDQPIDLFYLTGQELSLGRLLIDHNKATLFVDGRYLEACQKKASVEVVPLIEFKTNWLYPNKKIGFDADCTTYSSYQELLSLPAEWIALPSPLKHIRAIKEKKEIEALREAAELGSQGFDYACTLLKEGISEQQLALELEFFWRKAGAEKLAFTPHVAFGEGSSQPHYHTSERTLQKDEVVLIDIGVVLNHYHSDMTRVVNFGTPNPKIEEIYQIVYAAYSNALCFCRPGVTIGVLDAAARDVIAKAGYEKYFPHSLGHGVGLEIHEAPLIRSTGADAQIPLQEGMVITIEPGIYLPGIGGVRLEDTVVITKEGFENLTNRPIPSQLPHLRKVT
ncbi:MAG: putative peptidase [Chlamydiales bacterium]|nr:putative peptidase [Chlamydiales bacterium]